jgi:hypothetical protein
LFQWASGWRDMSTSGLLFQWAFTLSLTETTVHW